jgi:soluble lytic murein transglycosylase-like protein
MRDSVARQLASVRTQPIPHGSGFFAFSPPVPLSLTAPARADCPPLPERDVDLLVRNAAANEGVDSKLLRSMMKEESGYRPCAISPKGALGLMQLLPSTAERFGVRDPFNPTENVEAGARFLKQLLVRYNGDRALALGAYNAGPTAVDRAHGVPPFTETIEYVGRILSQDRP